MEKQNLLGNEAKNDKQTKFRGVICWGIFGVFLLFFIIMTAVFTRPKDYSAATPVSYLEGEDQVLYKGLGRVYFQPTTRKMNAMAQFQLGLQQLNLFWYDQARAHFIEARKLDPRLAMAYWGEAMTYKQPLWQTEDVDGGQAVLVRLEKAGVYSTASVREQKYIDAVRSLFDNTTSLQQREQAYAAAMKNVAMEMEGTVRVYADDPDACGFYALSLMGQLQSVGNYLQPAEIASIRDEVDNVLGDCVHSYPEHAGLRHYQTTFYDVSDLSEATKGVDPSVALARLAPASARAQHMRSHIAIRFGNWSQVVESNTLAIAASDNYCKAAGLGNACDADNRWHSLEWLAYGLTQQCAFAKARVQYTRMQTVAAGMNYTGDYGQWLYRLYAHMQLQSMQWLGVVPLRDARDNATAMVPPPLMDMSVQDALDISDHFWPPHAEAHALLARAYSLVFNKTAAAVSNSNVTTTLSAVMARLDAIVATVNAAAANGTANTEMASLLTTVQLQARAMLLAGSCANGANASACDAWRPLMDQAMVLHNATYASVTLPTLKIAPTPEFYGLLLLQTGQNFTAAAEMFDTCLDQLPGRMPCVYGYARASRTVGNMDEANTYYRMLIRQCNAVGDARFPPLVEALAATAAPPPKGRGRRMFSA